MGREPKSDWVLRLVHTSQNLYFDLSYLYILNVIGRIVFLRWMKCVGQFYTENPIAKCNL